MIVVSDTSAISALLQIGRVELLSSIYGEIFVPEGVKQELLVAHLQIPDFIRTVRISDHAFFTRLRKELDDGEAEAIVLAKQIQADELLIDEVKGRRVAVREGIHVIGLMGVLLESKLRGLIPSVRPVIEQLESSASFWVADSIKETIFRAAGEL